LDVKPTWRCYFGGAVVEKRSRAIGDKVRLARESASLSQEGLADLVGLSRNAVSNIEAAGAVPKADTLWRISQATGKPLAWFFQEPARPPFVTNILPDILAGMGLAPESPPQAAPASAPPGPVDMHALLAQLVQSQAHLSHAMARMAEGQARMAEGQARMAEGQEELRRGQAEIARAVADMAAQEQGATRTDARHRRERAG
jgi:transcriptional regulator with XRE-family HTH domain